MLSFQQFVFQTSNFPEHKGFLEEKKGVALMMGLILIPLLLSLIIDFRERKNILLNKTWYSINLLLIIGYIAISQLDRQHSIKLVIAASMTVMIILLIKKQKKLCKEKLGLF